MNNRWLMALLLSLLLVGCGKYRLDAEVRELCAKDGGIKVYEMVKLPAQQFDKWGTVNFYHPADGEDALGHDYLLTHEKRYYQRGNPEAWRDHYQVIRRSDGKVLGEIVWYVRRGGDIPGPWHDSSFGCPENLDLPDLLKSIFVKSSN